MIRPQSAPRGFLRYYILHRISIKPAHGYEILQDIDGKTEGAWRPGPGSVYPILKWLSAKGYATPDKTGGTTSSRVYHITSKGAVFLENAKAMFNNAGQRLSAMRHIFIELIDSAHIAKFFSDGSQMQFRIAQEIIKSRLGDISPSEIEYILREYVLNLERQLSWANQTLKELSKSRSSTVS